MTSYTRVFHSDTDDHWYYWDDAWENAQGPFDDWNQAHMALTTYLERHAQKEQSSCTAEEKAADSTPLIQN